MRSNLRELFTGALILFTGVSLLGAQDVNLPPEITPGVLRGIAEHGFATLGVVASDPEGDPLTYSWSIPTDPTGNAFFRLPGGGQSATLEGRTTARLGLTRGPNFPDPSFVGQTIEVRIDVSDSVNTSSFTFPVPVNAVNHPPEIILDTSQLGTIDNPRLEGQGFSVDARQSRDEDGDFVNFFWRVVGLTGAGPCQGTAALVLHLKETATPVMVVPKMNALPSNPAKVSIEYIVEDGLYILRKVLPGYMASPNGCSQATPPPGGGPNNPPVVSAAVNVAHARFDQTVTLTGSASDPGDTLTYSWMYLSTTGGPSITVSGANSRVASFVAPRTAGFYSFRFTATDSANQSRSTTVTVQVSQNGGSGGGGGSPPPSMGGTEGPPATGQTSCGVGASEGGTNKPATATVPSTYSIAGGNRAEIRARNARDPDGTTVNIGFGDDNAIRYAWAVVDSGGFLNSGSLIDATTATVKFDTPVTSQQRNATLSVAVKDARGCGTVYMVSVAVQPTPSSNNAPNAVLQYLVEETGQEGTAEGNTETVVPPAQIRLDASDSFDSDGGNLTFNWTVQPNLAGISLSQGTSVRTLSVVSGVAGDVTVTVTVSDGQGGSVSRSVTFRFEEPDDKPVLAQAEALRDGAPIDGPVPPGVILILSGAETDVEGGTAEERANLTYSWRQITPGLRAFARNTDTRDAEVIVEGVDSVSTLTFRLTARNGTALDTADVSFTVDPSLREETFEETGELRYAQVGFGPLNDGIFQTVLVIDNVGSEDADDVRIDFFNSDGEPLEVDYVDTDNGLREIKNWVPQEPLLIPANTSRVVEFRAPEGAGLQFGWASVTSSARLRGSVRFQEVDLDGNFRRDVGISSSLSGSQFQSALRSLDGIAFAIANPGSEAIEVRVTITDRFQGWTSTRSVTLGPRHHTARFVQTFFNNLVSLPEEGTIEFEVVGQGTMIPTLLITLEGLAVSSQSLARVR